MGTPGDIAKAFLDVYAAKYAAADTKGLGELYGDDSVVSFDGQSIQGKANIVQAITPRCASGGVGIRWITYDAQSTPGGYILITVTGESSVPAGKFSQLFSLFALPNGGMYVKNDIVRFGPGAVAFNTTLDPTSLGAQFAQQYYAVYGTNRPALAGVYRATSRLTFEGKEAAGVEGVMGFINQMPGGKQDILTLDVHPIAPETVVVLVTGKITLEGQSNALNFAQGFQIVATGGPHVSNEFFRFNYG